MVPKMIEEELNCKVDEDNMRKKLAEAAQHEAGQALEAEGNRLQQVDHTHHITQDQSLYSNCGLQTAQLAVAEVWGQAGVSHATLVREQNVNQQNLMGRPALQVFSALQERIQDAKSLAAAACKPMPLPEKVRERSPLFTLISVPTGSPVVSIPALA